MISSLPHQSRRTLGFVIPVVLIAAWQIVKSAGALPYDNVPAPSAIAAAVVDLAASGQLGQDVGHTVLVCLCGWAAGSVVGLLLGLVLGLSRSAFTYGMASVEVLRAIPAISFVPIAVILLGLTIQMEVLIASWIAIWPVAISTIDGVRGVSPIHQDLARSLRLSRLQRITKFALPTALPKVMVALRLSLSGALVLAIVAEIVGDPAGIGYALVEKQQSLQPAAMLAYILITGVLGLVLNYALTLTVGRLVPGARLTSSGANDAG